jgi:opacity protein-like surface antigen
MFKEVFTGAVLAVALAGSAAAAPVLTFTGTGETQLLTATNDLGFGGQTIQVINGHDKSLLNGLAVSGPAKITFTYLGFEAGNSNQAVSLGGGMGSFMNGVASVGDTISAVQAAAGLIEFIFQTLNVPFVSAIANHGIATPASKDFAIGYLIESATSAVVMFDDLFHGDRDFDDLGMRITVSPIPLPAGGLLLLGGLGALAFARRRRA